MNHEEPDPGAQSVHRQIAETRLEALNQVAKARATDVNPHRVTFGRDSPVRTVHAAVFRYYDSVRPYRVGSPELWGEERLGTIHIPQTFSEASSGDTSATRTFQLADDVSEVVEVRGLLDLDPWRQRTLTYQQGRRGAEEERRVWLSLDLLQTTVDALSDALAEAGMAATLPEKEVNAEPI